MKEVKLMDRKSGSEKCLWIKRPLLLENGKKLDVIKLRVDRNLKRYAKRLASRRNLTVSELVRRLLIKELEKE